MAECFAPGDEVIVLGLSDQLASWIFGQKRGRIKGVLRGNAYPNVVEFDRGGTMCFADAELKAVAEVSPGHRMLAETEGFALGVDTAEAHKIMRRSFAEPQPESQHSAVDHPAHYTSHPSGVECIEITQHFNFPIGNAIKYLWRAPQG
ncbi:DUF3310 domain-containing protein [Streptomyces stramineus]